MKNERLVSEWMKRAKSNLKRARYGIQEDILYEDLCFDCQQAVEKSIKAMLVALEIDFPYIHIISKLMKLLEKQGVVIPEMVKQASVLTDYAIKTRYPSENEPITEKDYQTALEIAIQTVNWVETELEKTKKCSP